MRPRFLLGKRGNRAACHHELNRSLSDERALASRHGPPASADRTAPLAVCFSPYSPALVDPQHFSDRHHRRARRCARARRSRRTCAAGGYLRNIRAARMRDGGRCAPRRFRRHVSRDPRVQFNEGAAVVGGYNALGYAAAAIGNHEFDYGPVGPDETAQKPGEDPRGALKARAASARFPFLAANTLTTRRDSLWHG